MLNFRYRGIGIFISLSTLYFFVNGCAVSEAFQSTKIKRYRSATYEDAKKIKKKEDELVKVSLFGTKITESKSTIQSPTIWSLSDRGQAEMIKVTDKRNKKNEDFLKAVQQKHFVEKKSTTIKDYTKKNLKMIFSISKNRRYGKINDTAGFGFSTADRIEYLKIDLKIDDAIPLVFEKWNKFETAYNTIDIADVSFSKTFTVQGGVNASKSKTSTSMIDTLGSSTVDVGTNTPSISASVANTSVENQKVTYRYISLNGSLSEKNVSFEQEGMRDIDLAGNVILDIQFRFEPKDEKICEFSKLFDENRSPNVKDVSLKLVNITVPNLIEAPEDITANMNMIYVYRHVKNNNGRKTFYEWDDKVIFYEGEESDKQITLFRKRDYVPNITTIALDANNLKIQNVSNSNEEYSVLFNNHVESQKFLEWLLQYPIISKKRIDDLNIALKKASTKQKKEIANKIKKLQGNIVIGNYKLMIDSQELDSKFIEANRQFFEEKLFY